MKLVSINIEGNLHNRVVLDFLKSERPDVICIQELLEEDFDLYKKELNMEVVYQPFHFWDSKSYPTFRGKKQGVAIFAKNILDSGSVFYAGKRENMLKTFDEYLSDEEFQKNRALVWADIADDKGEVFRFVSVQLPVTQKGESTPYQLEVVGLLLEQTEKLGEVVLCGDMNAPRGNESFTRIARRYKDNIPLEYKTSIDQNLHKVKGLQYMVDGLFTTPSYKALNVKLVDGISDHMAVVAEIDKSII